MDTLVQLSGFGDTLLGYLVPFLFVLTVVVFVHELGHFLVARWCGVAVKTFSIGFGPEIFGFNDRHGTRWRLSWIPLGGYVKFIDDENAASAGQKSLEQLTPEERTHSFQGKSLGQRAAIVAAGPIANFILAIVIFTADLRPVRRAHHRGEGRYRHPGQRRRAGRFPAGRQGRQHRRPGDRELQRDAAHRRHEPRSAAPFRRRARRQDDRHHRHARAQGDHRQFRQHHSPWAVGHSAQRLAGRLDAQAPRSR